MTVADLTQEKYVALTSFRRDGTPVRTAVWCAGDDGHLLVWTAAGAGKVKRIRRDPHVTVAPSNASGAPKGDAVDAVAEIVDDTSAIQELLTRKYGVMYKAVRGFNAMVRTARRRPPEQSVTLVIRDG